MIIIRRGKKLWQQVLSFLFVSGIGWLIDFSIYFNLTKWLGFSVLFANCISSVPAVLWVFWFSSKRIFMANRSKIKLYQKYLIYFAYQLSLVVGISFFAEHLYTLFMASKLASHQMLLENIKMLIKATITPVTMALNFIVMKSIVEKF